LLQLNAGRGITIPDTHSEGMSLLPKLRNESFERETFGESKTQ